MSLYFQSLISSSAGNCLVLWSDNTRVVIDCGSRTLRGTRELLERNLKDPAAIDAVLVSHLHGDHINGYSLRVIQEYGLSVRVHERCLEQLRERHFNGHRRLHSLDLQTFSDASFTVGDLWFRPFAVPHHPDYPNYGFAVRHKENGQWKKAVIVTDFHDGTAALDHFADSDFIFVESNHDLDLLAQHFNPNSRFHMSNPETAALLCRVCRESARKPHTVMLGHLSSQRNTQTIALEETRAAFRERGMDADFSLSAAPLYGCSPVVKI